MTIAIEQWVAYTILCGFVLLVCFLCRAFTHIHELQHEFDRLNSHDVDLLDKYHLLEKQFLNLADDFEKIKGSVEVVRSEKTSGQNDIYMKSIAESLAIMAAGYTKEEVTEVKEELDISEDDKEEYDPLYNVSKTFKEIAEVFLKAPRKKQDCDGDTDGDSECVVPEEKRESLKHHMEFWAGLEKISEYDISDDEKEDEDHILPYPKGVKFVAYRWIFPTKEKCQPVFGQWYTVIGAIRGKNKPDGTPLLCTEQAMWNGYQFVSIKDERFDKVYAYIKMPDSGDIMETIVELALEKE